MNVRRFVIELRGGPASGRRTLEGLDLAAGLADFGHRVDLVLHTAAIARLAASRGDAELAERLALVADAGLGPAIAVAPEAPDHLGPLPVVAGDADAARSAADAVLAF